YEAYFDGRTTWITNTGSADITVSSGGQGFTVAPGQVMSYNGLLPLEVKVASSVFTAPVKVVPVKPVMGEDAISRFITKLVTIIHPGDRVVICVDDDYSNDGVAELANKLSVQDIPGIIIQGARAGKGFGKRQEDQTSHDARMDTLARIAAIWENHPELKLTDLLGWWDEGEYDDDIFAACTEAYVNKLTEKE
ncbi:MAG TPA: hypothetical protein VGR89_02080, partial [Puia sp.]|nr:hypothetical protein [Puia sp.]